jgi:endo-1,4-beta-xylanase
VEAFIDENNEKTAIYQGDDGQYRVNFNNERSFGSQGEDKRVGISKWNDDTDESWRNKLNFGTLTLVR